VIAVPSAKRFLLAVVLLAASGRARADAFSFTPSTAIYEDDKNRPLAAPEGVACTENGRVVIADTGNGRLVDLTWRDGAPTPAVELRLAQLPYPTRVQIAGNGDLLVLDRKLHRIGRVDAKSAFAGWVDAKAAGAQDRAIVGAFKQDGNATYVLDLASSKVLVVDGGGGTSREIDLPRGGPVFTDIAVDAAGTVYAVDAAGGTIWSANKAAKAFTALAKGLRDYMSFPGYLAASRGRLFVVDQNGHGVVVLGADGSYQGRQLSVGWTDGLVYYPAQLCLRENGVAFLADRYNNRVQVFATPK
jgi:DNA-binding beta-propeller fold protein YncE